METRLVLSADCFVASEIIPGTDVTEPQTLDVGDIDRDGDLDLLVSAMGNDQLLWLENASGDGDFKIGNSIESSLSSAKLATLADFDGDDDLDVLATTFAAGDPPFDAVGWYENVDGMGTFAMRDSFALDLIRSAIAADVDGDDDLDILITNANQDVLLLRNTDAQGTFADPQPIVDDPLKGELLFSADVDDDGDQDVIATSNNGTLNWLENANESGAFVSRLISNDAGGVSSVFAADVDGDGDPDVLASSSEDNNIVWYENSNGTGLFNEARKIAVDVFGDISIVAADFDGDDDQDVLSASRNTVVWYENSGEGVFETPQVVSSNVRMATAVLAGDIDGDGDADLISASGGDDKIAWYENQDGRASFGDQNVVNHISPAVGIGTVQLVDIDNDGDNDLLADGGGMVTWYENMNGIDEFAARHVVDVDSGDIQSLVAVDLDGDSQLDLVSASRTDTDIGWYRQTD